MQRRRKGQTERCADESAVRHAMLQYDTRPHLLQMVMSLPAFALTPHFMHTPQHPMKPNRCSAHESMIPMLMMLKLISREAVLYVMRGMFCAGGSDLKRLLLQLAQRNLRRPFQLQVSDVSVEEGHVC